MRTAFGLLALANGLLFWTAARTRADLELLTREKAELEARFSGIESSREEKRALQSLVEAYRVQAAEDSEAAELGIAGLRDTLLRAEQGLGLERLSLEFRPESDLSGALTGSRVQASLRGSFQAIYWYLARLESMRLPLAPAELTLREEALDVVSLSSRWTAAWPSPGATPAGTLSVDDVARLSRWMVRAQPPGPGRDPFHFATSLSEGPPAPPRREEPSPPAVPEALVADMASAPALPALAGFVIARPELEPDANRRVLAALRFDGKLHLAAVGDVLGPYRVEAIDSRESVTLSDELTGEKTQLRLP